MEKIYHNNIEGYNDLLTISKTVLYKIVQEVIMENKQLFIDKSYLKLKNDKTIDIDIKEEGVDVSIDVNVKYGKNVKELAERLQAEIKLMLEHLTEYKVDKVNIRIVGIEG